MKGKILVLSLIAIMFCIVPSPGSVSYLAAQDQTENEFTVGKVNIRANTTRVNCNNIAYESTCTETISLENIGTVDTYTRTEIWVPTEILAKDATERPLYYDISYTQSDDFDTPETYDATADGVSYSVYRFTRSGVLTAGTSSGAVKLNLTNYQVASASSGDLNSTECDESGGSCDTTSEVTASLKKAGIKVYSQAIQAQGFQSASEAFNNI